MGSTYFTKLPEELITQIAENLTQAERVSLLQTCWYIHVPVKRLLYRHNIVRQRSSALFWGAEHGRVETIKAMLEAGADVNMAARNGHSNGDAESSDIVDAEYCWFWLRDFGEDEHDPTRDPDREYWHAIHLAAKFGHDETVEFLLDHGADIHAMSFQLCQRSDQNPFHTGLFPVQKKLPNIAGHIDVCHHDWDSGIIPRYFPLHFAIRNRNFLTAKLLIRRGASLQTSYCFKSAWAENAWFDAVRVGDLPMMRHIRDICSDKDDLHWATLQHHSGKTAIHLAATHCPEDAAYEVISELISLGSPPNATYTKLIEDAALYDEGYPPLTRACLVENKAAIRALLDSGADPNKTGPPPRVTSSDGNNDGSDAEGDDTEGLRWFAPLTAVALDKDLVETLVNYGAPVDQQDSGEVTALHVQCNHLDAGSQPGWLRQPRSPTVAVESFSFLLQQGARVDIRPFHQHLQEDELYTEMTVAEMFLLDHQKGFPAPESHHFRLLDTFVESLTTKMLSRAHWQDITMANIMLNRRDLWNDHLVHVTGHLGHRLGYQLTKKALQFVVRTALTEDTALPLYKLFLLGEEIRFAGGSLTVPDALELAEKFGAEKVATALRHESVPKPHDQRTMYCFFKLPFRSDSMEIMLRKAGFQGTLLRDRLDDFGDGELQAVDGADFHLF